MPVGPIKFTFKRPAFEAESECGSFSELIGILQDEGSELIKLFGHDMQVIVEGVSVNGTTAIATGTVETTTEAQGDQAAPIRGRPRKPRAGADPATASAPPPIEVPAAAAPPTVPGEVDTTLPAALDRSNPAAVVNQPAPPPAPPAVPPAPPAPPAPPVVAAPPPTGVLAGKVATAIDARATTDEAKTALADWLVQCGICVKGATYAESMDVLRLQPDERLGSIAAQLGVA